MDINKIPECDCDANQFYNKYKYKIETLFFDAFGIGDSDHQLTTPSTTTNKFSVEEGEEGSFNANAYRITEEQLNYAKTRKLGQDKKRGGNDRGKDGKAGKRGVEKSKKGGKDRKDYYCSFGYNFKSKLRSDDQYEDSLGYYQKLFDMHIHDLYGEAAATSTSGYLKTPRIQSEVEYEESFDYAYEDKYEGPWISESQQKAENYLKMHRIYELFHFLGSHLIACNPDNPVDFLINLLDKCLKYRCGILDPPLLFTFKHVESLFDTMDPMSLECIDINQYYTAMMTLGIGSFEKYPQLNDTGFVTKDVFIYEALKRLQIHLDEMIQNFSHIPKVCVRYSIQSTTSILEGEQDGGEEDRGVIDAFQYSNKSHPA